jgi:branched-chain amino acid transport system ATP-binding protein
VTEVIGCSGLSAGYDGVAVVRDIDITVEAGSVVALIGPNGAGKTTTLMSLAGEVAVLGGEVRLNGAATTAPLHLRSRSGLALVTEERSVLMRMTVAENLKVARCDSGEAYRIFPELRDHADRRVGLLSGGQQQMLALARALARDTTKILLADELSFGLAPLIFQRLLTTVRAAADRGIGVLLVEQHVHQALQIADTVHVMRRGRIELSGPAHELRGKIDEIQESYLSVGGNGQSGSTR